MKTCTDCGGDVGKGWTWRNGHRRCASCDTARRLGSPIPPRMTSDERAAHTHERFLAQRRAYYWAHRVEINAQVRARPSRRALAQRRKFAMWQAVMHG